MGKIGCRHRFGSSRKPAGGGLLMRQVCGLPYPTPGGGSLWESACILHALREPGRMVVA